MSLTSTAHTNKDGVAFAVANIDNTATSIVYSITDALDLADSYNSSGVSTAHSGSANDTVLIVAGTSSHILRVGTGASSANGTFQALEGHTYNYSVYTTTPNGSLVGTPVNGSFVYHDPMDNDDFTVTPSTTADSVGVAIAYAGAESVDVPTGAGGSTTTQALQVKATHYFITLGGADDESFANQKVWRDRLSATSGTASDGDLSIAKLDTDLVTDFTGTNHFATEYVNIVSTNTADGTNGTYTITDTGVNGTTKAVFQVIVVGQVVTKVFCKARGAGYAAADTITLPRAGAYGGSADVVLTLTADDVDGDGKIDRGTRNLTTGSNYELTIAGEGAYGFTGGNVARLVTPSSGANPVTMKTPVIGSALKASPYDKDPTDETISILFTPGTQASNADFKDVAYIMRLSTPLLNGPTNYYRKVSAPFSDLAHMSGLATNTVDAVTKSGSDYFYTISSSTKWVSETSGDLASADSGSPVTLTDGIMVQIDVLSVNKDADGNQTAGTASGDPRAAIPQGVPAAPVTVTATVGSGLGATDADMSGKLQVGVQIPNTAVTNGTAITHIGFKLTGGTSGQVVDKTVETGNDIATSVAVEDDTKFYSAMATGTYVFTVSGLNNGETYTLSEVSFKNANGEGADYAGATVTGTPVTLPDAPTVRLGGSPALNVMATPLTSGQIKLTWTAPASNGGTGVALTDYSIEYSTASDYSSATSATALASVTEKTISGLANGTTYYFRIKSNNANGGPSAAWLEIAKDGGNAAVEDDRKLVPSAYPDITKALDAGMLAATVEDVFNGVQFTVNPAATNNAFNNAANKDWNKGYAATHVRVYLVVAGKGAGETSGGNVMSVYKDVAVADLATLQSGGNSLVPTAAMITAANSYTTDSAKTGKYYLKMYLKNAVYGVTDGNVRTGEGKIVQSSSGSDLYVPYYNTALSFTTQPTMTLSDVTNSDGNFHGTKMTISWEVSAFGTAALNTVPLSSFNAALTVRAPTQSSVNNEVTYATYAPVSATSVGLSAGTNAETASIGVSGTTRTYSVEFTTNYPTQVHYGWFYKWELTANSDSNGTNKTVDANTLTDMLVRNRPTVVTSENGGASTITFKALPNGSMLGEMYVISPSTNDQLSINNFSPADTAYFKNQATASNPNNRAIFVAQSIAGNDYPAGERIYNDYIDSNSSLQSTKFRTAEDVPGLVLNHYLFIAESDMGTSLYVDGNPLSQFSNGI